MNRALYVTAMILAAVWTAVIFVRSNAAADREMIFVQDVGLNQSRAIFQVITDMREWAARMGGVYVPVSDKIQPNPYLVTPRRDVKTTDGEELTLMNPAYITRQVAEIGLVRRGVRFHITGPNPLRPENSPALWEKKALETFLAGKPEYHDIVQDEGKYVFRYMAPLPVEEPCLKCHTGKERRVGEVMGGISIAFPVDDLVQKHARLLRTNRLFFAVVWMAGVFALAGSVMFFDKVTHGGTRKL